MKRPTYLNEETSLALIKQDITYIKDSVKDINTKLNDNYVSQDQFEPVKRIVYGLVSVILLAVVGAVTALVINTR